MGEQHVDAASEAAMAAVEKTTSRIADFLAERRRQAEENDVSQEADYRRHLEEKAEAVRIRNEALRARFAAMGLPVDAVENFLAALPENIP